MMDYRLAKLLVGKADVELVRLACTVRRSVRQLDAERDGVLDGDAGSAEQHRGVVAQVTAERSEWRGDAQTRRGGDAGAVAEVDAGAEAELEPAGEAARDREQHAAFGVAA